MDLFQQDQLSNLDIEIDSEAKNSLDNAAYWGKFISILVMSFVAIILLVLAVANTAFMNGFKQSMGRRFAGVDEFGSGFLLIAFFIIFILLGLIYYFLYNFSVKVKTAIRQENTEVLNKGLNSLKTYLIIMGVLGILEIILSIFNLFFN